MSTLAELLAKLAFEGVKRYEAHTGLSGIGQIVNPVVQETANSYAGHIKLDNSGLSPVFELARLINQHWDRLRGVIQPSTQQVTENVPSEIPQTLPQPVSIPRRNPMFMQGAPIPGYQGKVGVRQGRDIRK